MDHTNNIGPSSTSFASQISSIAQRGASAIDRVLCKVRDAIGRIGIFKQTSNASQVQATTTAPQPFEEVKHDEKITNVISNLAQFIAKPAHETLQKAIKNLESSDVNKNIEGCKQAKEYIEKLTNMPTHSRDDFIKNNLADINKLQKLLEKFSKDPNEKLHTAIENLESSDVSENIEGYKQAKEYKEKLENMPKSLRDDFIKNNLDEMNKLHKVLVNFSKDQVSQAKDDKETGNVFIPDEVLNASEPKGKGKDQNTAVSANIEVKNKAQVEEKEKIAQKKDSSVSSAQVLQSKLGSQSESPIIEKSDISKTNSQIQVDQKTFDSLKTAIDNLGGSKKLKLTEDNELIEKNRKLSFFSFREGTSKSSKEALSNILTKMNELAENGNISQNEMEELHQVLSENKWVQATLKNDSTLKSNFKELTENLKNNQSDRANISVEAQGKEATTNEINKKSSLSSIDSSQDLDAFMRMLDLKFKYQNKNQNITLSNVEKNHLQRLAQNILKNRKNSEVRNFAQSIINRLETSTEFSIQEVEKLKNEMYDHLPELKLFDAIIDFESNAMKIYEAHESIKNLENSLETGLLVGQPTNEVQKQGQRNQLNTRRNDLKQQTASANILEAKAKNLLEKFPECPLKEDFKKRFAAVKGITDFTDINQLAPIKAQIQEFNSKRLTTEKIQGTISNNISARFPGSPPNPLLLDSSEMDYKGARDTLNSTFDELDKRTYDKNEKNQINILRKTTNDLFDALENANANNNMKKYFKDPNLKLDDVAIASLDEIKPIIAALQIINDGIPVKTPVELVKTPADSEVSKAISYIKDTLKRALAGASNRILELEKRV